MSIKDLLLHFGYGPPVDLRVACPAPASGQTTAPYGVYDYNSVRAAFDTAWITSLAITLFAVAVCYLITRSTMGPRFKRRFAIALVLTGFACAAGVFSVLRIAHTTAMAGSCESNTDASEMALPADVMLTRSVIALLWGPVAFYLFAWFLTYTLGRWPGAHNGFFHNRGWPWPRALRV